MSVIDDSNCANYTEFMSRLAIIESSIPSYRTDSYKTDFEKISNFFENNKEYMAQDKEVALHCDSIANKVRGIDSDTPLITKMQGVVRDLLPADKSKVHESLAFIRQSKSADEALANWINAMEVPLASLNLSKRELENILPLLTYIDLTDFNDFTDKDYYRKLIQNFNKPNLKFICPDTTMATKIALECAKQNVLDTIANIQNFGIKEESALVSIALECAKQNGWATAQCIHNFGIKEESRLVVIALGCAKQNGRATALAIQNFGIKEERALVSIALECAKENGRATAENIQKFGIKEERALVSIALECAKQSGPDIAFALPNFRIKEKSALVSIVMECAKQDGRATALAIQNFGIREESALVSIALECAKQNSFGTIHAIERFGIKKESALVSIALECAKQDGWGTAEYIQKFGIKEERNLVSIALGCAKQDGRRTAENIQNFGIKEESSLVSIALECAKQNGGATAEKIQKFGIQDAQIRYQVFMECMKQNEESFFLINNFKLPQKNLANLFKFVQVLKSNEGGQEQRNALFTAVRSLVEELPCSDDSQLIIEKKIDEIAKLKPHTQNRAALWLLHSLSHMVTSEASMLDWMLKNGLWNELGNLRRPALRGHLTPALFNLASTKNKKEWDDCIATMKEKKPARLALLGTTLPLASAQLLSTLKVDKNSSLNDVHKFTTLLEAAYLLSSASFLTEEQKSCGFGKVIPEKQESDGDYQRKLIKNATAAKGLMQLKSFNWVESEKELGILFRECFEQLIPLREFVGDASEKYEEIFAKSRNPGGLLTYAAGLKTLNDPQVMDCLGQFVAAVFRGDFKEMRYDTANHPHLSKIAEKHPEILKMWKEGFQVKMEGIKGEGVDVFNLKNWVSTKLTVDKHLGDADLKYVVQYLKAQSDEDKKAISNALVKELSDLMTGKNKKEVEKDPACVNLKLQMECMKLANGGEEADLASFKKEFSEIERLLSLKYAKSDFKHDVEGIIQSFEKSKDVSKVLHAVLTDDPIDWMQCGTDVAGSCQRLDGTPSLNKGLLGYMMDGKNRLLVIKDAQGKIVARTLLSLLWDGEKPVLYRERFYPDKITSNERDALNQLALQFAEKLNIPVTENEGKGDVYGNPLQALGGPAPYEWSDASGGIQANGRYTIASARILSDS